ncbi:hypothetical protein M6B38_275735 [Iris pallida]|uniref:Uncharacterized protein n=1 Tax=Iris pallida TaxID=29817 RepID=A0AAX6I5T0_IRIPA|nr:hypothetical protein M6B38_275735 [Iris pallida]
MINAGERFLSAHINTGDDLGEVTESSSYCFQGSTIGVGALFRRCWVVDILLWVINHQWNGWNWKKENLGWWLLLSRQYTYCMNPYLRGKQEEMFSSRRKQLMLLGMNMLIYFASNMISRNYMKLLELDNVVDEELFTMATLPVGHAWMNTDLEAAAAASESSCVVLESNGEPEGRNTAARGALRKTKRKVDEWSNQDSQLLPKQMNGSFSHTEVLCAKLLPPFLVANCSSSWRLGILLLLL